MISGRVPTTYRNRRESRSKTRPNLLPVRPPTLGNATLRGPTKSDRLSSDGEKDGGGPGAIVHSTGPPEVELLRADFGNTSKIEESLGVSQIRAAPFPEVCQCFFCQRLESTRSHVLLKLTVPNGGIVFGKPSAKGGQIVA
jgi:hypothetical protein